MGFETPITIEKVIQGMQENKYVLPAIQREFVWDGEQIEKLFDSLMRGYPIGSFLFWKIEPDHLKDFQFYRFIDHYNDFANLQLLQGPKNIAKSDQYFDTWLSNECKTNEQMAHYKQMHFIPNGSLNFEDFPNFLDKREKLLRTKLAAVLDVSLVE